MGYLKHQRVQHFLRTVRQQCRKCNVRLVLSKGYEVNSEGERCQGYFNQPDHRLGLEGEIRVATGSRRTADWMYTLAHEYAHFLQWMRDDPILDIGERDYWTMEAQTEREALEICRQFKLPIPRRVLLQEHRRYMKKISRYKLA
jgi:hypothetical protein